MTIKTNLTQADYRAFQKHVAFRYRKLHLIFAIPLIFVALSSWFGGKPGETAAHRLSVVLVSIVFLVVVMAVFLTLLWLIKRVSKAKFMPQLGAHTFEVTADGVIEENEATRLETKTVGIQRIDDRPEHYFVITKSGLGHIIPKRDVPNPDALLALKADLERSG